MAGPPPDPNKEIHFSLTIGPRNDPRSAILTVDWGPEDCDVPTYCWQQKEPGKAASIANRPSFLSLIIQSGTHNPTERKHPRKLRIPAWGVSGGPSKIKWSDQDRTTGPKNGEIIFRPPAIREECQSCPQPIP